MLKYLIVKNKEGSSNARPSRALVEMNDSDSCNTERRKKPSVADKKLAPIFAKKKKQPEVIDIEAEEEAKERRRELRKTETSAFGGGELNPFFQKRSKGKVSKSVSKESAKIQCNTQWFLPFAPVIPLVPPPLQKIDEMTSKPREEKQALLFDSNPNFFSTWIDKVGDSFLRNDGRHHRDTIRCAVAALGIQQSSIERTLWHEGVQLIGSARAAADQLTKWLDTEWDDDESMDWDFEDEEIQTTQRATLLVGPLGSGKTAAVRTAARNRGYEILNVNANSATELQEEISEATQSKRIQRRSLIFVDDVETRLAEDPAFRRALCKIILGTRVPVVLTALIENTFHADKMATSLGCGSIIRLTPLTDPSPVLEAQLLLKAPDSTSQARHNLISVLIDIYGSDLRQLILQLQLELADTGKGIKTRQPTSLKNDIQKDKALIVACDAQDKISQSSLIVHKVNFSAIDESIHVIASEVVPYILLDGVHRCQVISAKYMPQDTVSLQCYVPKNLLTQGSFVDVVLLASDGRSSVRTASPSTIFEYETELPVTSGRLRKAFGRCRRSDNTKEETNPEQVLESEQQLQNQHVPCKRRRIAIEDDDDSEQIVDNESVPDNSVQVVPVYTEEEPLSKIGQPASLSFPPLRKRPDLKAHNSFLPTIAKTESHSLFDVYEANLKALLFKSTLLNDDDDESTCAKNRAFTKRKRRLIDALDIAASDRIFAPRAACAYIATEFAPAIRTIVASEIKRAECNNRRRFHHYFHQHNDTVDAFKDLITIDTNMKHESNYHDYNAPFDDFADVISDE